MNARTGTWLLALAAVSLIASPLSGSGLLNDFLLAGAGVLVAIFVLGLLASKLLEGMGRASISASEALRTGGFSLLRASSGIKAEEHLDPTSTREVLRSGGFSLLRKGAGKPPKTGTKETPDA